MPKLFALLSSMEGQNLIYHWQFRLESSAGELWPLISNTNLFFQGLRLPSIRETNLSRNVHRGFLQLSNIGFKSYEIWEEQPYQWEIPYRFGTTRFYKIGLLQNLKYQIDLTPFPHGTLVDVKIWASARNGVSEILASLYINNLLRRNLRKTLYQLDHCVINDIQPYELAKAKQLPRGGKNRLAQIKKELIKQTKRPRIVNRLITFITKAEDWQLLNIHPYKLAEYWGEKKYAVLNVFLHASKLELLDFGWEVSCPSCRSTQSKVHKLKDLQTPVFCTNCEEEFDADFNGNMHLVFKPHPLIRKPSDKVFCLGGPQLKPHIHIQQYLLEAETKYLKVHLEYGTYVIRRADRKGEIRLNVVDGGYDNVNVFFSDDDLSNEEIDISRDPNLVFMNRTATPLLCSVEKVNWKEDALFASEISSLQEFRSLFNDEILREGEKIKAKDLTILFTDLLDSTGIYLEQEEELAVGQVMSHFKIIQQIVAEERGAIVKTIGDSVMAVFREPISALNAVNRIQTILSTSTSLGESFKLKAGIHIGDCTAVNLNNRIDFFGTNVNIAARLVDFASEKEIVISDSLFKHADVQRYLSINKEKLFVKDAQASFKGFSDEEFSVKQIRMEKSPLRLVI